MNKVFSENKLSKISKCSRRKNVNSFFITGLPGAGDRLPPNRHGDSGRLSQGGCRASEEDWSRCSSPPRRVGDCCCQAALPEVVPDFDARERVPGDDEETRQ